MRTCYRRVLKMTYAAALHFERMSNSCFNPTNLGQVNFQMFINLLIR